jgi:hypothetical protein
VGGARVLDQALVAVSADRADERVGRDPVRPAREDPDAVEHEAEEARARLLGVGTLVELERAHADPALAHVDLVAAGQQRHPQVVQRRLAEVVRPPQRRVAEREVCGRPAVAQGHGCPRGLAAGRPQLDRGLELAVTGEALRLDVHLDERVRADCERREVHAREGRLALAAQLDGAPQPDRREPRPPVPAEAVLRLAHPHALGRGARPLLRVARARVLQRRVEADREQVLGARQHAPGHVEGRLAEHVRVAAELVAVEEDRGERVGAVQDEPQPLVGRGRLGPGERDPIPPLALLHPRARVLVAVVERVLDPPRLDERGVHVAGHVDPGPALAVRAGPCGAGVLARAGLEFAHHSALAQGVDPCDGGGRSRPRRRRRHYFTPPAVSPRTISFCAARKAITTGALTTIAAAISWFQYTLVSDE